MAVPNTSKREAPPTHPGEVLREEIHYPHHGTATVTFVR